MNERVRNLYIQAINDTKHHPADDINTQIAEKFAELIVKECANIVEEHQPRYLTRGQAQEMADTIKQHFGAE